MLAFGLSLTTQLLLLVCFVAVPGLAMLRLAGFRYRRPIDLLLATSGTGLAVAGGAVYLLLLAGAYRPWTAWLVLALPGTWLAWNGGRDPWMLPDNGAHHEDLTPSGRKGLSSIFDTAAVALCGLHLSVVLVDAATSPLTSWDAVIVWDKWATDWAKRSTLFGYPQGGYPQLLPMISSLLYKVTGQQGPGIPDTQYALHAFHAVLGWILLATVFRGARLLRLPAWPCVLLVFAFGPMADMLASGTADLMVTVLFTITLVLYLGWQAGEWEVRAHGAPVLGACLFGALFAKATGCLAALGLLLLSTPRPRPELGRWRRPPGRWLGVALVAPFALAVPFYAAQWHASGLPAEALDPLETKVSVLTIAAVLRDAASAFQGGLEGWGRLETAVRRLLGGYGAGAGTPVLAVAAAVTGLLLAGARTTELRGLLLTASLVAGVWFCFTTYDVRNALPALPLLALGFAAGGVRILDVAGRRPAAAITGRAIGGVAAIALAAGIVGRTVGLADQALLGGTLQRRLAAAGGTLSDRTRLFFPDDHSVWTRLESGGFLERANYVAANSYLYRWHARGIYADADWLVSLESPGDLFIADTSYRPPGDSSRWEVLYDGPLVVWLLHPATEVPPESARRDGRSHDK